MRLSRHRLFSRLSRHSDDHLRIAQIGCSSLTGARAKAYVDIRRYFRAVSGENSDKTTMWEWHFASMMVARRTTVQLGVGNEVRQMLRITLLGGFQVEFDGQIVDDANWRLSKARNLVKLLALADDHQLHREQIMDILWPEMDPVAANNNFHQVLFAARRALSTAIAGDTVMPVLRLQNQLLSLEPSIPCWIDAEAFQQGVAVALRSTDPADSYAAAQLYGGELLPEDRYEDWAIERRDGLRARYLDCLLRLAGLLEGRGEAEAAIDVLRQVLATDPVHEDAHIGLMRLYALTGRRQQAMRQFEHLREVLERELDAEPADSTGALYASIRAGDFTVDRSPSAGLATISVAWAAAFRPTCRKRTTRCRVYRDRPRPRRDECLASIDVATTCLVSAAADAM